jgi:hypothetical protein
LKKIYLAIGFLFLAVSCRRPAEELHNFGILSQCRLPGYARDLDLRGDCAYVADDQGGLQIVDIADPDRPFVIGSYSSQVNVQGIAVRDSFAYLALAAGPPNSGGLVLVNVAHPKHPVFVSQDVWFYAYNVSAPANDTQYVYIAGRYWFIVEDVSWPQYPNYARRFATAGNVRNLQAVDSLVFLACEQIGLLIYNLNHPDSTAQIGAIDSPSNALAVFIQNGYAYIADGNDGLVIIDVRHPERPVMAGHFDTPGNCQGVAVQDSLVYLADGTEGLQVVNASDPANPKLYGTLKTDYAYNVQVRDSLVYLVDRNLGLVIISKVP